MKNIFLLSGWRTVGKDTFFNEYSKFGFFEGIDFFNENNIRWYVYRKKGITKNILSLKNPQRFAFADKLKKEVSKIYNVKNDDNYKEKIIFEGKTFRDLCIFHGTKRREENIDYWCEKFLKNYKKSDEFIITDFRFINEYEFMKKNFGEEVITIRLNRSSVPIPLPLTERSEHELDNFDFDYQLFSEKKELENYNLVGYLVLFKN